MACMMAQGYRACPYRLDHVQSSDHTLLRHRHTNGTAHLALTLARATSVAVFADWPLAQAPSACVPHLLSVVSRCLCCHVQVSCSLIVMHLLSPCCRADLAQAPHRDASLRLPNLFTRFAIPRVMFRLAHNAHGNLPTSPCVIHLPCDRLRSCVYLFWHS